MWLLQLLSPFDLPELVQRLIYIAITCLTGWLVSRILRSYMGSYIKKHSKENPRASTIAGLFRSIVSYLVGFLTVMAIAENGLGISASSLLAGVSIVSVAVGFGAQDLVKDVIAGLFILVEQQYSVGDSVTIGDFTGTVWELGLRSSTLSNGAGDRFTIPNGSIGKVINHSRLPRSVTISCTVPYDTSLPYALGVLEQIGAEAFDDKSLKLTEKPSVNGVTKLSDTGVTLQMVCKCAPGDQFALERAMLARVKEGFDKAGVEIYHNRQAMLGGAAKV